MIEEWKAIPGYEGQYEISSLGRVQSLSRLIRFVSKGNNEAFRLSRERIVKQNLCGSGYLKVGLVKNCEHENKIIHRLVAEAFLPNPNNLPEVHHVNGNKLINRADNLQWVSRSENKIRDYALGIRKIGTDHHFSKLDRNDYGHCVAAVT